MFEEFTGFVVTNDEENASYVLLEIIRGMVVDVTSIAASNEEEAIKKAVDLLGVDVGIEFIEDVDYCTEEVEDDDYDEDYEDEDDCDDEEEDCDEDDYDEDDRPLTEDEESFSEYWQDPNHWPDD